MTMKKLKIYLDTSVISMLDDSVLGIITRKFFEIVNKNNYELVISPITDREIKDAPPEKKEDILIFLKQLNNLTELPIDNNSYSLAWNYVLDGILTPNHFDDLLHVAYATIYECDFIVSWNRKHIAKKSKIDKINIYNIKNNYRTIIVYTPHEFLVHFN
jgi:hypothetical protein